MFWRVGPPSPSTQPMSRAIACGVARSTPSSATAASNCVWSSADHVNRGARGPSVWGGSAIAATMAPLVAAASPPHARRRAAVEVVSRGSRSAIARRSSSPRWAGSAIVAAARCAKCSCAARSATALGAVGGISIGAAAAGVARAAAFVGTRVPRPRRRWTKPSTTKSPAAHGAHGDECGGSPSKTSSRGPRQRCVWLTTRYWWSSWSWVRTVVHSPAPRAFANSSCDASSIARTRRASTKKPCSIQLGQNFFFRWPLPMTKPGEQHCDVPLSAAPQQPVSTSASASSEPVRVNCSSKGSSAYEDSPSCSSA